MTVLDPLAQLYLLRTSQAPDRSCPRGRSGPTTLMEDHMARRLLTGLFWLDAAERMVRAAASSALATIGTGALGIFDVAWSGVASIAGLAAVVSLLTSIVAGTNGDPTTAGFATDTR